MAKICFEAHIRYGFYILVATMCFEAHIRYGFYILVATISLSLYIYIYYTEVVVPSHPVQTLLYQYE